MKKEKISEAMGNISSRHIQEAAECKAEGKLHRNKNVWVKWVSTAACFCLIVTVVICISMMNNDGKIISEFKNNDRVDSIYAIPLPGECIFFYGVEQARKAYMGKDVRFLLAFDIFKDGKDELSDEELEAEYQRLSDLGYKLYLVENHWTYRGSGVKEYIPIVVGLFTEDQLASFEMNELYGYGFHFESNGDGSSITVDEKDAITNFNTNIA